MYSCHVSAARRACTPSPPGSAPHSTRVTTARLARSRVLREHCGAQFVFVPPSHRARHRGSLGHPAAARGRRTWSYAWPTRNGSDGPQLLAHTPCSKPSADICLVAAGQLESLCISIHGNAVGEGVGGANGSGDDGGEGDGKGDAVKAMAMAMAEVQRRGSGDERRGLFRRSRSRDPSRNALRRAPTSHQPHGSRLCHRSLQTTRLHSPEKRTAGGRCWRQRSGAPRRRWGSVRCKRWRTLRACLQRRRGPARGQSHHQSRWRSLRVWVRATVATAQS